MDPPTFLNLRDRFAFYDVSVTTVVGLDGADQNAEAQSVLQYLSNFGFSVSSLEDLYQAIEALDAEEELAAFRCREGIAVSHASDGWWLLFQHPTTPASM